METREHVAKTLERDKSKMTKRGKFIVFEGNDGAGKSTQAQRLADYLIRQDIDINMVLTKEPGGIRETTPIRALIFDPRLAEDGLAQLLLFAADRRVHLILCVVPALLGGKTVISDRYYGSTRVYQKERGVSLGDIVKLEDLAIILDGGNRLEPDITILLDVDPTVGRERKRNERRNYFDKDSIEQQQKRRELYLEQAQNLGWEIIDGGKTEEEVFEGILDVLKKRDILPLITPN